MGKSDSPKRGSLQTVKAGDVAAPVPRVYAPPQGPPDAEVAPPPPPPRQPSAPTDGFYGRMFSGDVGEDGAPAMAPPPPFPWRRVGAIASVLVLLAGAGAGAAWWTSQPAVLRTPVALSATEERGLAELWLAFGAPGPIRKDAVADAVTAVGTSVATTMTTQLGQRRARFLVVEHRAPRTMALPDGTVTVSTGLLGRLKNDAELAGILGHALAHVALGHVPVMAGSADEGDAIKAALKGGSPVRAIDALRATAAAMTPEQEQAADALMAQGLKAAEKSSVAAVEGLVRLQGEQAREGDWQTIHPLTPARRQRLEAIPPFGAAGEATFRAAILLPLRPSGS